MTQPRRVLLIHGLLNRSFWLWPLAVRLRELGFEPDFFSYSSLLEGSEVAVPKLIEHLRETPADAIVGHSLGGLIALAALREAPELQVARVVCLGSPLRGSATAQKLADSFFGRPLLGRSADLLLEGLGEWNGHAQAGMIAGDIERGMGRLLAGLSAAGDEPSDGTVNVAETRLPGLADHIVIGASHSGLVFSPEAAAQAEHFLREGRFSREQ